MSQNGVNDPEVVEDTGVVSLLCLTLNAFTNVYSRSLLQPANVSSKSAVAAIARRIPLR